MGEDDDDCTLFDFVIEKVLLKEGSPTLAARVLARLDACEVKACNIKEAEAYELWNMLQQVSRQGLGKYVAPVVDDEDDAYMVRKKTTFGKSLSREVQRQGATHFQVADKVKKMELSMI